MNKINLNMKQIGRDITFEEFSTRLFLSKEHSQLLKMLFPKLSHPTQSRFLRFFKSDEEINSCPQNIEKNPKNGNNCRRKKKEKKHSTNLNLIKIINGNDKRTSLMIKNIPTVNNELSVIRWLKSLTNLNYVFVPKNNETNRILGYAFINVCKYSDILKLIENIKNYQNTSVNNKKIEVCYSHKQGFKLLTKSFGLSSVF